ncbi:MAG TPA: hypothetical protein VMU17_00085 [Elusimicrobiota bacterium]|nr:hypothetical protein [Elusimicrobiota bacterium]
MKILAAATFLFGAVLAASAANATERATHHVHHIKRIPRDETVPVVIVPRPEVAAPWSRPYARVGEGDDDGLSRNPDDCNKGCIGGNPR